MSLCRLEVLPCGLLSIGAFPHEFKEANEIFFFPTKAEEPSEDSDSLLPLQVLVASS